jgi:hypothetical protein
MFRRLLVAWATGLLALSALIIFVNIPGSHPLDWAVRTARLEFAFFNVESTHSFTVGSAAA